MQPDFPNVVFHKIDVDENEEISMDLEVSTIPHFIFFKDGEKIDEQLGSDEAGLRALLEKHGK